jgi:hypothetical protein
MLTVPGFEYRIPYYRVVQAKIALLTLLALFG